MTDRVEIAEDLDQQMQILVEGLILFVRNYIEKGLLHDKLMDQLA